MTGIDWNAVLSSGVLAQGLGAIMWAVKLEWRVRALEKKGQSHGKN